LYLLVETGVLYNRTGSGFPKLACQNSRALVGGGALSQGERKVVHIVVSFILYFISFHMKALSYYTLYIGIVKHKLYILLA